MMDDGAWRPAAGIHAGRRAMMCSLVRDGLAVKVVARGGRPFLRREGRVRSQGRSRPFARRSSDAGGCSPGPRGRGGLRASVWISPPWRACLLVGGLKAQVREAPWKGAEGKGGRSLAPGQKALGYTRLRRNFGGQRPVNGPARTVVHPPTASWPGRCDAWKAGRLGSVGFATGWPLPATSAGSSARAGLALIRP
jgi:hypothetical protein